MKQAGRQNKEEEAQHTGSVVKQVSRLLLITVICRLFGLSNIIRRQTGCCGIGNFKMRYPAFYHDSFLLYLCTIWTYFVEVLGAGTHLTTGGLFWSASFLSHVLKKSLLPHLQELWYSKPPFRSAVKKEHDSSQC